MDFFTNSRGVSLSALFTFKDISDKTQRHLYDVYSLIMMCCITCASGMYMNATFVMSGFIMTILTLVLAMYLTYQTLNRNNSETMRKLYLNGVAFLLGFLSGPLIHTIAEVEPKILV